MVQPIEFCDQFNSLFISVLKLASDSPAHLPELCLELDCLLLRFDEVLLSGRESFLQLKAILGEFGDFGFGGSQVGHILFDDVLELHHPPG